MPELPEAETIVRTLRSSVEGRRIVRAEFFARRVCQHAPGLLEGRRIDTVTRYGKHIHFQLDSGVLAVKLGMTGSLLVNQQPGGYTRARLILDQGTVCFDDTRQFGSLQWQPDSGNRLGPDPLEITAEEFARRLGNRNTEAKRALLDQSFVRGVGNIYADEALFRAGIHPRARTRRLRVQRARHLHASLAELLEEAITLRGSSVSDYVDASGQEGDFQTLHRVYRKHGEPCVQCGTEIRRIVITQRGTHFCPNCQRR